jgi:hypothetical protein
MKKILQLAVLLSSTFSFGQATLPIYEGFNYNVPDKLVTLNADLLTATGLGTWAMFPLTTAANAGTDDILVADSPGWSNGLPAPTGVAISFKGSGVDPYLPFSNPNTSADKTVTTGSVYASFVFTITDNSATTALSVNQLFALALPNSTNTSISYCSALMLRTSASGKGASAGSGSFNIGLDKTPTTSLPLQTVWDPTDYAVGSQIVIVISYNFTTNTANMWINPTIDTGVEPKPTLTSIAGTDRKYVDRVRVQQSSTAATPTLFMDEIRLAASWSEVLGGPAPIVVPTPGVEKKQAFNSSSNPTVASLVATGTDIKWYDALAGGTALSPSDAISSKTYYVTQTIGGTESARISTSVYVGDTSLKTLPLHENFNYNVGDKLVTILNDGVSGIGIGSWGVVPVLSSVLSVDDMLIADQPSSWASSVLPTPTGKALTFDKSGLDPQLLFNAPTTGSVYASFLFMVTNLNAITAGTSGLSSDTPPAPGQIFSFAYADTPPGSPSSYTAAVYLKSSATPGKFNIGINAAPADPIAAGDIFWDLADYDVNTPITLVTRYSYDDLISKLWINPTSKELEPAANATTLARPGSIAVNRVRLNQSSSATTPFITLDELRVANNWGQALGGDSTLSVSKIDVSKFSAYPNPVTNGKLYISSANSSEKQVSIYSILGQKVLDARAHNNSEINVSPLAKGTYILKISENGVSDTKKLIIE